MAVEYHLLTAFGTGKAVISGDGLSVTLYEDDGVTLLHSFTISSDKNVRTPA